MHDILIVGGGLSGLQLLHALLNEPSQAKKRIGIIEASPNPPEKTWCFWEKGKGSWDELLHYQWDRGKFIDFEGELSLEISPYQYKMLRSVDFVNHFKSRIGSLKNVDWIADEITEIDRKEGIAKSHDQNYRAELIFDSRFDQKELEMTKAPMVLQHFKGWFIETESDYFNPEEFVMMDFRQPYGDLCSFTYVLPFSKRNALVEYTFFSPTVLKEEVYDTLISSYIQEFLSPSKYRIKESEAGVIPMSSYDFEKFNTHKYTRIGTAGGWVKASSGYSFKHAEKKSQIIAKNLAKGIRADQGLSAKRFKLYDRIFLNLLQKENHLGNGIFIQMYRKNKPQAIFKFLDEDTTLQEEFQLINRFKHTPFLRALGREIF